MPEPDERSGGGSKIGKGSIEIHGTDLQNESVDVIELAQKVGMVFQNRTLPQVNLQNVATDFKFKALNPKGSLMKRS